MDFLHDDRLAYVYATAFGCTALEIILLVFQRDQFATFLNIPKLVYPWIRGKMTIPISTCYLLQERI